MFGGDDDSVGGEFVKPTWAAVVRSGNGESGAHAARVKEMERKVREENLRKDVLQREQEDALQRRKDEEELQKQNDILVRQKAFEEAASKAKLLKEQEGIVVDSNSCSDDDFLRVVENLDQSPSSSSVVDKTSGPVLRFNDSSLLTAIKHKSWLESKLSSRLQEPVLNLTLDQEMGLGFSGGATRLAIEYQGVSGSVEDGASKRDRFSDDSDGEGILESTPKRQRTRKKRRDKVGEGNSLNLEENDQVGEVEEVKEVQEDAIMDLMSLGSSFITDDDDDNEDSIDSESSGKKLRSEDFDFDGGSSSGDGNIHHSGDEEVFEGEGYMAANKEGVSGQDHEMSSLVPENTLRSSVEGGPGGV